MLCRASIPPQICRPVRDAKRWNWSEFISTWWYWSMIDDVWWNNRKIALIWWVYLPTVSLLLWRANIQLVSPFVPQNRIWSSLRVSLFLTHRHRRSTMCSGWRFVHRPDWPSKDAQCLGLRNWHWNLVCILNNGVVSNYSVKTWFADLLVK